MTSIADLIVCKNCKNVYTDTVGGVRTQPTKCPVCKDTQGD